jgi:hypothetical protein
VAQAPLFEMNVRPAGVGSETLTFVALSALLFVTAITNVIVSNECAFDGPLFTTDRSMLPPVASGVVTVDELFVLFASFVELLTDAVLLIELPVKPAGTLNVDVIVAVCPDVIVLSAHGNGALHAPEFETNVRPAGVGSLTNTFDALSGPLFVTVIV